MNDEQKVVQIPIEDIIPNRFQPRLSFDEEGLKELSDSIKQHGIIQPLVLRRLGNKYEIIAGERRFKASTMAGLRTVPAIISNIDDNKSAEIALVENIQRRNLTAIEEAKSYKNLLDRGYMTQEQLAAKMGVSQSSIANKLRLLNLSTEVQDALLQEKISERHARSLLAIPKEEQQEWLNKIITKRMTVRQLDLEIKKAKGEISDTNVTPTLVKEEPLPDTSSQNTINNEIIEGTTDNTGGTSPSIIPNKFFNFLEDEAANMNMEIPNVGPSKFFTPAENINTPNEEIEVLDDFDIPEEKSKEIKQEQTTNTPNVSPFFINNDDTFVNNNIEEIKDTNNEPIIDPIDSVMKLDPGYEEQQKVEAQMDLKTAINNVRDLTNTLETKGFEVTLDEIDLEGTYQMTINIKK